MLLKLCLKHPRPRDAGRRERTAKRRNKWRVIAGQLASDEKRPVALRSKPPVAENSKGKMGKMMNSNCDGKEELKREIEKEIGKSEGNKVLRGIIVILLLKTLNKKRKATYENTYLRFELHSFTTKLSPLPSNHIWFEP